MGMDLFISPDAGLPKPSDEYVIVIVLKEALE